MTQLFGILRVLLIFLIFGTSASLEAAPSEEKKLLKVMSYNIHYGVGMDKKKDLARIAKIITDQNLDLVGLQEIESAAMAAELGRLTEMKFVFGASLGKKDGYGDAILSKHPFEWVANHSIPSASSSRYQVMGVDVDLSALYGEGKKVRFLNTHFDWLRTIGSQEARLATVEVIERAFFAESAPPAILTGDLNATPESPPLQKLREKGWFTENLGEELVTIGSAKRGKQIDYILLRSKESWRVVEVEVLQEPVASDHLPIVMTVELVGK